MSERMNIKHEADNTPEQEQHNEHTEALAKKIESRTEHSRHEHKDNIDKILTNIEKTAQSSHNLSEKQKLAPRSEQTGPKYVSGELKTNTLKRSLKTLRKDLKPYQRPFSKLIHNDVVDQASDIGAKTIARPEGLLGGGLAIFLTSIGILLVCKYYGYQYNYLIGLVSFPIGYLVGVLVKFMLRTLPYR